MIERVLVTGASGLLGSSIAMRLHRESINVLGLIRSSQASFPFPIARINLLAEVEVREIIRSYRPTTILHAAALSKVIDCEQYPEQAFDVNVRTTESLLRLASAIESHFIFVSTDQVFDGETGNYSEKDSPAPTHVYGKTKYAAEHMVTQAGQSYLIARSNNIVGSNIGWGQSFTDGILERLRSNQAVELFADQYRSPIHLRAITSAMCKCIEHRTAGILHLGGPEKLSRYETGQRLAEAYGIYSALLKGASMSSHVHAKTLHRNGTFDTGRYQSLFPECASFNIFDGFRMDYDLISRS